MGIGEKKMGQRVDANGVGVFEVLHAGTGQPCSLTMQELTVCGRVLSVGARLLVRHIFRSAEKKPLEAVYAFSLPRDAALMRFRIKGECFNVESELKPREEAREQCEEAMEDGHLAAIAESFRDGVANLRVGNIKPGETVAVLLEIMAGVEVHDKGYRFRFPFCLPPCYHPQARPFEVAPGRGEIALPPGSFDDVVLPQWVSEASETHRVGFDILVHSPQGIGKVTSPSHSVRVEHLSDTRARVMLAESADVPNRDLVIDVRSDKASPCVLGGVSKDGRGQFAAIVPSEVFGTALSPLRRIVFVLDRSGSMNDLPIEQAKDALAACLGALSPDDSFGIIAFDNHNRNAGRRDVESHRRGAQEGGTISRRHRRSWRHRDFRRPEGRFRTPRQ